MRDDETISDGLARLGYTHKRDEFSTTDGKHRVRKDGVDIGRMTAHEAAELVNVTDRLARNLIWRDYDGGPPLDAERLMPAYRGKARQLLESEWSKE